MSRDLDLESGHVAHGRVSLIDLYLRTKFHSNGRKLFVHTNRQTDNVSGFIRSTRSNRPEKEERDEGMRLGMWMEG